MSENDENPELDPQWERTKLLDALQKMYETQIGSAALHMTNKLTAIVVWEGTAEPPEDEEEEEAPTTFTIQVSDFYLSLTAVQIVLDYRPDDVYGYSLSGSGQEEELDQGTAELDEYFYDLIQRATFKPKAAEDALNRIVPRRRRRGRGGKRPRPE